MSFAADLVIKEGQGGRTLFKAAALILISTAGLLQAEVGWGSTIMFGSTRQVTTADFCHN